MSNDYVLVIDDNELVRVSIRDILSLRDIPILLAPSGQSGIELFAEHKDTIGLVLLDLTMPHMDGVATLRKLRKIDPNVPIIIMSAYDPNEREKRLEGERVCGVLSKPFDVDDMFTLIETHCPNHNPNRWNLVN